MVFRFDPVHDSEPEFFTRGPPFSVEYVAAVEKFYRTIEIPEHIVTALRELIVAEFDRAFFDKLYVQMDDQIDGRPGEPFNIFFDPDVQQLATTRQRAVETGTQTGQVVGLNNDQLVGLFSSHANELRKAHHHLSTEQARELRQEKGRRKRTTQPRVSDEQVHRITEDYALGKTVYELATEFNCHRVTISAVLKRRGVTLRHASPTSQQVDEMVRRYEDGSSLARVGDELGFNASTVLTHLREREVRTRAR